MSGWRSKVGEGIFLPNPLHSLYGISPNKKMSSTSGCILTGELPGINTFSQNGNNYDLPSPN
jgi:hypothetical protein